MNGVKHDKGKAPMHLLLIEVPRASVRLSEALSYGEGKYGRGNWRNVPEGSDRYLAATLRHLTAHASGEKVDDESGLSHLAHAAANIMFLLDADDVNHR